MANSDVDALQELVEEMEHWEQTTALREIIQLFLCEPCTFFFPVHIFASSNMVVGRRFYSHKNASGLACAPLTPSRHPGWLPS